MTYNVSLSSSSSSYSVSIKSAPKINVQVSAEASSMTRSLADMEDFNPEGVHDKYLIMYDATTQKYITVNPDEVLLAAITDPISPGMPADYIDQMSIELDDKIDLDAGSF